MGLDGNGDDGRVTEVWRLTRVVTAPLDELEIASAALGHTHSAVVTGKYSSLYHCHQQQQLSNKDDDDENDVDENKLVLFFFFFVLARQPR